MTTDSQRPMHIHHSKPTISLPSDTFARYENPFARAVASATDPGPPQDDAPASSYTYRLLGQGPDVPMDEVEVAGVPSVEVMVLWGAQVLHVAHLTPPRDFYVGESQGDAPATDYVVPAEKLGTGRMPIVLRDGDSMHVVIPAGATGTIEMPGSPKRSLDEIRQGAEPLAEPRGACRVELPHGALARVAMGDLAFHVAAVTAGKTASRGLGAGMDWTVVTYFGLSLLSHAGLMAAMALFVPPLGLTDDDGTDKSQRYLIQQYLDAAAERELERAKTEQVVDERTRQSEGGSGERSSADEGAAGKPTAKARNTKFALQGPANNPDPHVARERVLRDARSFGMLGVLATAGDPSTLVAPWGRDTALGADALSAEGGMWGDEIGEGWGAGGLALSGVGEGGGGIGEGIGLGPIGTIGHGAGLGTRDGFGDGGGRPQGTHATKSPSLRTGQTIASGRLPPEVIQRVVRQNFGRFRLCYEQGLGRNPNLEGRVAVRFVIGRDGAVSNAANGGSDVPDSDVVACVIRGYYGLSFPAPESGIVTVTYPIMFSPG